MVLLSDNFVASELESAHVPKYAALFQHLRSSLSNKKTHFWTATELAIGGTHMMQRILSLGLILCLGFMLSGCGDKRVTLSDNVASDIDIGKVTTHRNAAGFMEVVIVGENDKGKYFKSEYRIIWLDDRGAQLETILSKWTPFPVHEETEFRITAVAPHPRATDFRIVIRKKEF